jgi:hypothetical protein
MGSSAECRRGAADPPVTAPANFRRGRARPSQSRARRGPARPPARSRSSTLTGPVMPRGPKGECRPRDVIGNALHVMNSGSGRQPRPGATVPASKLYSFRPIYRYDYERPDISMSRNGREGASMVRRRPVSE